MNLKKRKLWNSCLEIFEKNNIKFENDSIMEDVIDDIVKIFIDTNKNIELIILDKFPTKIVKLLEDKIIESIIDDVQQEDALKNMIEEYENVQINSISEEEPLQIEDVKKTEDKIVSIAKRGRKSIK